MNSKSIKFRVFNKVAQRWFYYRIPEDLKDGDFDKENDWNTLGRFTDHLDRFGVEIYQGDLIGFRLDQEYGEVVYIDSEFLVTSDGNCWYSLKSLMDYEPQVITDIYQDIKPQELNSSLFKK